MSSLLRRSQTLLRLHLTRAAIQCNYASRIHPIMFKAQAPTKINSVASQHFSTSSSSNITLSSHCPKDNVVTINFVNRKGEATIVEAAVNDTLLDVVVDNDLDVESFGVCEGTLGCSTCHVILEQKIFDLLEKTCSATCEEMDMLDLACGLTETSRLGCQVEISKDMEGCTVHVPKQAHHDIMYSGGIHSPTGKSSKFPLDKKADLRELSQQMRIRIAQLKSQLGIKTKDEDDRTFEAIEDLASFGRNFHSTLDRRENELKLLNEGISNLHGRYLRSNSYTSFSPREKDPFTPRTSSPRSLHAASLYESFGIIGIPSRTSAFSPRLSTSLSEKDLRLRETKRSPREDSMSTREDAVPSRQKRSSGPIEDVRRKSSSSISSSHRSTPRKVKNRSMSSRKSSSSFERRTSQRGSYDISDIAEDSPPSSTRSKPKSIASQSSRRSVRSQSEAKRTRNSMPASNAHRNTEPVLRLKPEPKTNGNHRPKPQPRRERRVVSDESSYSDSPTDGDRSSSEHRYSSSSCEDEPMRREDLVMKPRAQKMSNNKFDELEKKLILLQQRCDLLEQENEHVKKEQQTNNNNKIADLMRRNAELVKIARGLEQRARSLQLEKDKKLQASTGSEQDLLQQKKNFLKLRNRMETEHSKLVAEKEHQIEALKGQIDDLKKSLKQSKALKFASDKDETLNAALRQSQMESMQLQKLAAANSKKVIIRSLSTPVTARQKILEEANRKLRRQVAQLEERCRKACDGEDLLRVKEELETLKSDYDQLKNEAKEGKIQETNLESQLQIAKVESSDASIKLSELTSSYSQLQAEYDTVHEQLSVAIKERDAAINQCKENSDKITKMETYIRTVQKVDGSGDAGNVTVKMEESHGAVSQYKVALEKLQVKVSELEKQCQEQNETNRLLNEQLMKLMSGNANMQRMTDFEATSEANNNTLQTTETQDTTTRERLDNRSASVELETEINANVLKATNPPQATERQKPAAGETVGNEDTEVEDFIEEELLPTMDNSDVAKLRVYIAKYTYNPYEGPNECPEAELPLVAGDYVYVYGTMDEDGFFEGELMNGRRGLVPSNFLEPVHNYKPNEKSPSKVDNLGSKCTSSEFSQSESLMSSCTSLGSSRLSHKGDLSDSNTPILIHGVLPYPKKLSIDKQLSHSLIIGWVPPQLGDDECVKEYHVFVNGEFKTAVNGSKQKAVVENIQHDQAYRISVCAVSDWGISDENLCVLSHGRASDLSPSSVKMEKISTASARVAWVPSSSQQYHVVTVEEEGTERFSATVKNPTLMTHTVPPPAYRFTFGNLRPNVSYKVMVSAKGATEETSGYTRFTTPEAGPPDPPLSVQVEECENTNYLLITWLPVTLNTMGTSNGVLVKGYGVYVGEQKLCQTNTSTADQCTIRAQTLADSFAKQLSACPNKSLYHLSRPSSPVPRWNRHAPPSITIKTFAANGQQSDHSEPCVINKLLFARLAKLIQESEKLASGDSRKSPTAKPRRRPPLVHSRDSTDVDVSFSSDMSIPGLRAGSKSDMESEIKVSHASRIKTLQQSKVVPSIEITHDTSSDEDGHILNGLCSRSSSNRSVTKDFERTSNGRRSTDVVDGPSGSPGSKPKKAHEPAKTHKVTYKESDNDDAASVSSSHTSSSAGGKYNSIANRANRTTQAHKLQRGESAEYSNPEDYAPSYKTTSHKSLNPSDSEKNTHKRSSDQFKQHRHHHHDMKHNSRRPRSVTSDEHSQGSHHSRPSSRASHNHPRYGKSSVPRQITLSSLSGSEVTSEVEPTYPFDKRNVGLLVALYDYDPKMSSPNRDTFDEELAFTEGQLIKVYGSKGKDGFYYGETHTGDRGFVPCNMVSEVEVESMQMLHDLHERGHLPSASTDEDDQDISNSKDRSTSSQGPEGDINGSTTDTVRYFVAKYDYDPRQLSPNVDPHVEIAFTQGDVIAVRGDMDYDGFFKGELNDKQGLVPSNYLEEISERQATEMRRSRDNGVAAKPATLSDSLSPPSPIPAPRQNHANNISQSKMEHRTNFASSSSTSSSRVDNAISRKKGTGFISKGKKLFKKLGGSQDGKHKR